MALYAYIRYSTDKQDEQSQLNIIQTYLSNKGMFISKIYSDEAISGSVSYTKRNIFELCQSIQPNDIIVVSEVSRITRSGIAELSEIINKYFAPNRLRLIICNVGLDIDCSDINPMAELQLAMMATFAKIERNLIRERTKAALDAKRKRDGSWTKEYGKNTGTTHAEAWDKALDASIATRKRKAEANENNIRFAKWLAVWESKHGTVDRHTDLDILLQEVNALGYKTSSGMEFNKNSLRAMIYRTKERNSMR